MYSTMVSVLVSDLASDLAIRIGNTYTLICLDISHGDDCDSHKDYMIHEILNCEKQKIQQSENSEAMLRKTGNR